MTEVPSPALSVIVPVYNGAGTVGELVAALRDCGRGARWDGA